MVREGLAEAVLLDSHGQQQPPTEVLRKRPTIIRRTTARHSSPIDSSEFDASVSKLIPNLPADTKAPLCITEFSINNVHATGDVADENQLTHVRTLVRDNEWVMVTGLRQSYKLSGYIRRYSQQPMRFVMGISTFSMLFSEQFYLDSGTGILEALGKLFTHEVKISVKPMAAKNFRSHIDSANIDADWFKLPRDVDIVSIDKLSFHGPMHRMFQYLLESDCIEELDYEPESQS